MESEIVSEITSATNMEVTIKEEFPEVCDDDIGVHTQSENFQEFGDISLSVVETKLCMESISTGYHVERKNGLFRGHVSYRGAYSSDDNMWLRCTLIRQNPAYRHFVVETICPKHRDEQMLPEMVSHVIQAVPQPNVIHRYEVVYRSSILFNGKSTGGEWNTDIALRFLCSDTCWTTNDPQYQGKEASRDLFLMLTMEHLGHGRVCGRKLVSVWPKAVVRKLDLQRVTRRREKGGAEQKKRNRLKQVNKSNGNVVSISRYTLDELEDQVVQQCFEDGVSLTELYQRIKVKFWTREGRCQEIV